MSIQNVVPRNNNESGLGTSSLYWNSAYITNINCKSITGDKVIINTDNPFNLLLSDNSIYQIYGLSNDNIFIIYISISNGICKTNIIINNDNINITFEDNYCIIASNNAIINVMQVL